LHRREDSFRSEMKAFQLFFACVLFHHLAAHVLHNQDGTSVDLDEEEFCTDVSQYSPKYYEDVTETCCTTVYEPNCQKKIKKVCMDVTSIICKPVAESDCKIKKKLNPGQSGPGSEDKSEESAPNTRCELVTENVDLNECTPKEVVFKHVKKVPHCENVTSLNCETGWKVVDGNKVWSGEEDCEDVTWEECKLVEKEVDFPGIESECGPAGPAGGEPYVAPHSEIADANVPLGDCSDLEEVLCEPVTTNECVNVPYDDCTNPIRKEECRNFEVKKPKQDFIHKKKCLLPSDIDRQFGGSNF